jgi:hypothetical protein
VYGGTAVPLGNPFYSSREISGDDLEYYAMAELDLAEQSPRKRTRKITDDDCARSRRDLQWYLGMAKDRTAEKGRSIE